jgi:ABC-type uncharacterized transport system auxiliary subunit
METQTPPRRKRQRLVIYIDPQELRKLKRERAETDKPLGHIVEEALAQHFDRQVVPSSYPV